MIELEDCNMIFPFSSTAGSIVTTQGEKRKLARSSGEYVNTRGFVCNAQCEWNVRPGRGLRTPIPSGAESRVVHAMNRLVMFTVVFLVDAG